MEEQSGGDGEGQLEGTGAGPGPLKGPGQGTFPGRGPPTGSGADLFDHEKLIVWRVASEHYALVKTWFGRKMSRDDQDQLKRAAKSIVSNICEGAGKTALADKRRSYEIARGSGMEVAGQLDMLRIDGVITDAEYQQARSLLLRVVKMLSRLCGRPRTS